MSILQAAFSRFYAAGHQKPPRSGAELRQIARRLSWTTENTTGSAKAKIGRFFSCCRRAFKAGFVLNGSAAAENDPRSGIKSGALVRLVGQTADTVTP